MSAIESVKGIVFSFKGKEMSNAQNMAVYHLIEVILGESAAVVFSQSMESSDEKHDSRTTYTYRGDIEFLWKNIKGAN